MTEVLVPPRAVSAAKRLAAAGEPKAAVADLLRTAGAGVAGADACDAAPLVASLLAKLRADPYACLGLKRPADDAEVKAAYRALSLSFHPDKADFESTAVFQALGLARDRLKDATSRADWDAEVRENRREAAENRRPDPHVVEEKTEAEKKKAEAKAWNAQVASTINGFAAKDHGRARQVANADRAERHRRASNAAAQRRRLDADAAATKKNRDSHRAWLKSQRLKRERSLERAAERFATLGGDAACPPSSKPAAAAAPAAAARSETAEPEIRPRSRTKPVVEDVVAHFAPGPLGLTLEAKTARDGDEQTVVKAADGAAAAAGLRAGDVLVGVNDRDARGHSFKRTTDMVAKATAAGGPRVLTFHRWRGNTKL